MHTTCEPAWDEGEGPDHAGRLIITEFCSHNQPIRTYTDSVL